MPVLKIRHVGEILVPSKGDFYLLLLTDIETKGRWMGGGEGAVLCLSKATNFILYVNVPRNSFFRHGRHFILFITSGISVTSP